eukprot:364311-Chlamydomonas_euryale.AAC.4
MVPHVCASTCFAPVPPPRARQVSTTSSQSEARRTRRSGQSRGWSAWCRCGWTHSRDRTVGGAPGAGVDGHTSGTQPWVGRLVQVWMDTLEGQSRGDRAVGGAPGAGVDGHTSGTAVGGAPGAGVDGHTPGQALLEPPIPSHSTPYLHHCILPTRQCTPPTRRCVPPTRLCTSNSTLSSACPLFIHPCRERCGSEAGMSQPFPPPQPLPPPDNPAAGAPLPYPSNVSSTHGTL